MDFPVEYHEVFDKMTSLRKFGIVLAVLLVGSVVFSGGALAQDNDVTDIDQTNVQVGDQDANINQNQQSTTFNGAFVANEQTAVSDQDQQATIDQDLIQTQENNAFSLVDF